MHLSYRYSHADFEIQFLFTTRMGLRIDWKQIKLLDKTMKADIIFIMQRKNTPSGQT